LRHRAFIPVVVPPVKPAGILHDTDHGLHLRFGNATDPILAGARVRIWGGYDTDPKWLVEFGSRAGVLGTVVRFLVVPHSTHREAVVQLDQPVLSDGVIGCHLVLRLRNAGSAWESGETVSIELCDFEPNMRFMRHRSRGVVVETSAICELL
jgi:hypothetical protein